MNALSAAGNRRLHLLITTFNVVWAVWAVIGGLWLLMSHRDIGAQTAWVVFSDRILQGYTIVGGSLLICGIVSFVGVCLRRAAKVAAALCAAWCGATAVTLQLATPAFDQGDIDAWLLLMCAITCVGRWALLALEPYVCE